MLQVRSKELVCFAQKEGDNNTRWGGCGEKGPNKGQQGCRWMNAGVWGERDIYKTISAIYKKTGPL